MTARNAAGLLVPPQRTKLHEDIAGQLKDKIISRKLLPGDKLPAERDLAESLGVNRSTVREALNKLHSMELLDIRHGDGVYVRDYLESGSLELVKTMLAKNGAPDPKIVKNFADLRRILVPEIAFHAALNRSRKDLRELEQIAFSTPETPVEDRDLKLHNVIARASGNLVFVVILNSFADILKNYAYLYFNSAANVKRSEIYHREIYEAIKNKQPEKAREIVTEVYIYAEKAMFKSLGKLKAS